MEEKSMLTDIKPELTDIPGPKPLGKRYGVRMKDKIVYKIVMCGGSNRGQTTFITRYTTGQFERTIPTIGVDFALKHLDMPNGASVTLQLWDIAGQERTQSMVRMYYQGAHACVIMFDLTDSKSLEICLRWKQDLDSKCTLSNGDPIPCILLANKSDLASRRKFSTEDIEKFSQENNFIHFMETSVKNNVNVEESMQYLVENLLTHEDLPRSRPRNTSNPVLVADNKQPREKPCC